MPRDNKAIRLLDNKNTKEANSLILWKGMMYVPKNLREEVLRENYNNPTAGHFGNNQTIKQLIRIYWWLEM
jgi:hypothetical protein